MDPQTNVYLQYYRSQQTGGQLNVFAGRRRAGQAGGSLGGILSGVFRTLVPVAARGGASYLSEMLKAHDEGKSWGEAMKSAIGPALKNAAESTLTNASKAISASVGQSGTGSKRKRRHKKEQSGNGKKKKGGKKRRHAGAFPYKSGLTAPAKKIKFLNF